MSYLTRPVSIVLANLALVVGSIVAAPQAAPDPWTERMLTVVPDGASPTTRAWDSWISLTPDLSAWAYAERYRSGDYWREAMVVNGRRGAEHVYASRGVLSPDGRHLAYIGVTRQGAALPAFLVLDGARVQVQITDTLLNVQWIPTFSPDSKKVAFLAERPGGRYAIGVSAVETATGDALPVEWGPEFAGADRPLWTPDSTTVVYAAARSRSEWVVMKGTEVLGPFEDATDVAIAPDGTVAFTASNGKKHFIVLGSAPQPAFDAVTFPTFRQDGTLMYVATDGEKHIAIIGSSRVDLRYAAEGVFASADGKRLTSWYREGDNKKRRMVINGEKGPYFTRVSRPSIDPNTGAYAYSAENERGFFIVTPRGSSSTYAGVSWNPRISSDGTKAAYAALQGNQLWWKVVSLK